MYLLLAGLGSLATVLAYVAYTESIWSKSLRTRQAVLDQLGLAQRAESKSYRFVGFFHPYWWRRRAGLVDRHCTHPTRAQGYRICRVFR
ncbi:hypothetical protein M404DRAFT_781184 [Pisolithus tinctorius Marx 270]|uniref:Uncharacterized protein n=1 Tax=Pisolithus tinctorius Marx 270 TaxID=870435 RepID=A0A0C3NF67_PISTI|nr:hypothetical protein M404DRAFT_781184 [Pisolithus tinctorius Marx 270]